MSQPQFSLNSTLPSTDSTDKSKSTSFLLTYFQFVYMSILGLIGVVFAVRFFFISRKGRARLSNQLRIHLLFWAFFMFIISTYALSVLIIASEPGTEYNLFWLVLRGSAVFASAQTAPLSTSFIALNRIAVLWFPNLSKSRHRFHAQILSVFLISLCFLTLFTIAFLRTYKWDQTLTKCLTFGCLMNLGQLNDILIFKMFLGWINTILGTIFLWLYFRHGKGLSVVKREKKKNTLVLLILVNDLIFNVLPTTVYIFFNNTTGVSFVTGTLGSVVTPAAVTDGFITTVVYYRAWTEHFPSLKGQKHLRVVRPTNGPVSSVPSRTTFNIQYQIRHSACY